MSKVISFRCSEELDEYLEQEAERRMTTKSTVAQMMVAERVQELQGGTEETEETEEADKPEEEKSNVRKEPEENIDSDSGENEVEIETPEGVDELPPAFHNNPEQWWLSDGETTFGVRCEDGSARYYDTVTGAKKRLLGAYAD